MVRRSAEATPAALKDLRASGREEGSSPRYDEHVLARDVAKAYLYGDSRKLAPFKAWLADRFPSVAVAVWPFLNVIVKSGSVLEFGPGPNVLVAASVTIESGGLVRARGSLKIDATSLEKSLPGLTTTLNPALLNVALVSRARAPTY
jgi:hypothetical protein